MGKKIVTTSINSKPAVTSTMKSSEPEVPAVDTSVRIVAVGASAGGLEALTLFLGHVPDNSGLAIVVIQHLDPDHVGLLPELLQRATRMNVMQVKDRTRVKPDCVYVIPPKKDMSILHGILHLFEPSETRGLRLPIDIFFRSLAQDCQERSIAVILSGMGSDGTLGLRAIKEKGGLTLVQSPASAKFSGMPSSAISFGLADIVAPVEELPGKILTYLNHTPSVPKTETELDMKDISSLEKITILLRNKTGNDFSQYKKNTLYRRIERRMRIHQLETIANYVRYLQTNSQEVELLFNELLIGVTSFFRDSDAWEQLRDEVFPALFAERPAGGVLRAWSAGCSTGEEAYSLAIVFKEALEKFKPKENFTLQIFATDLDPQAIDKARQGLFLPSIAIDVSANRRSRFFLKEESGLRVAKEIREMIIFAPQNVISDPPFTRLDILICRNLLIYLNTEMQKNLLHMFKYVIRSGGFLFLGSAETLGASADHFVPVNSKLRIFRRDTSQSGLGKGAIPTSFFPPKAQAIKETDPVKLDANIQSFADKVLLQQFAPPAVLVNDKGDLIYISARTGKYLEPPVGKVNWNVFAMAREGLRNELFASFQRALHQKEPIVVQNLRVGTNGGSQTIDLIIQRQDIPELNGMIMIIFKDVAAAPVVTAKKHAALPKGAAGSRIAELEHELQQSQGELRVIREDLQTTREEMQTSHEELKASNEELQSINEELQSTNEELTTSKEEMQSMNEELQTVNAEQQSKVEELSHLNDDMKNFLNNTETAAVFLDNRLNIRRFVIGANTIFKLIQSDVGRPFSDIANDLCYPQLLDDAQKVLDTLILSEKQILTRDERWFKVRMLPYRTYGDVIDGVVITLSDVTVTRKLEDELRAAIKKLEAGAGI